MSPDSLRRLMLRISAVIFILILFPKSLDLLHAVLLALGRFLWFTYDFNCQGSSLFGPPNVKIVSRPCIEISYWDCTPNKIY